MTTNQLEELKRIEAAAMPGPWKAAEWINTEEGGWSAVGPHHEYEVDEHGCYIEGSDEPEGDTHEKAKRDSAFIAAARTAVPVLIAEVERLRINLVRRSMRCPQCDEPMLEGTTCWHCQAIAVVRECARIAKTEAGHYGEHVENQILRLIEPNRPDVGEIPFV